MNGTPSQAVRRLTNAADGARRDLWEKQAKVTTLSDNLQAALGQVDRLKSALTIARADVAECQAAEASLREAIVLMQARERRIRLYGIDPIISTTE